MNESDLEVGIYEKLVDDKLLPLIEEGQGLEFSIDKIGIESSSQALGQFLSLILREALNASKHTERVKLVNSILAQLPENEGLDYLQGHNLTGDEVKMLTQVRKSEMPLIQHPETPLGISSLFTGSCGDPQLDRELRLEMLSADRVDILVSFIKWSGLRLLIPAFEKLAARRISVRIITTSYMGASDPEAVEWLAQHPSFDVRVSYDTKRTRLHAKAYHFFRNSGYSTAYIGSANMSHAAMTSGLEWTVKVTAQDMPHIVERFGAEFETYWAREEFVHLDEAETEQFRQTIGQVRSSQSNTGTRFFAEITPHPYQERILEALEAARANGSFRNLVVAATGTGKTVIAACDYARYREQDQTDARLLFVAHRKEILEQARDCFRIVLKDANFGELLIGGKAPTEWNAVFASIQSLNSKEPWNHLDKQFYDFIIIDEAHHGAAASYQPLFEQFTPKILLGLTATPERMDGSSILPDFENRFAAEIRLPEALEEKLLCPFHYFGVTDPISISDDRFWNNGKYDTSALTEAYASENQEALNRVDTILQSIRRYQPDLSNVRAVGFCASVDHAKYMADKFNQAGLQSEVVLGETPSQQRIETVRDFRAGRIPFLFVVDVFSEGVDVPEINLVMFLRPTESLTVFLQQLGRGLRHSKGKECLTVLDFVGQSHRKYRIDRKFAALLRSNRRRIDSEIEKDFPNLPPGCSIQLERIAKNHILNHIKNTLGNLNHFVPEALQTFEDETNKPLTFANFIQETDLSPIELLRSKTWSEWKSKAFQTPAVDDPDLAATKNALRRICLRTDPNILGNLENVADQKYEFSDDSTESGTAVHFLLWGKKGSEVGVDNLKKSFTRWGENTYACSDLKEIIDWRRSIHPYPIKSHNLPSSVKLCLHAAYGSSEIKSLFGLASLDKSGSTGVGVLHAPELKTYIHLVTFRKEDKDFAPTTRYKDYPIAPHTLHWESQVQTAQATETGMNYLNFKERGYTILFFARLEKKINNETCPFIYLGPASDLKSFHGNRPISMIWELEQAMPAQLFEEARTG